MNGTDDPESAARRLFEQIAGRAPEKIDWLSEAMAGRTGRFTCSGERFFVKWSRTPAGARALEAEADGLRRLHAACPEHVVRLIGCKSAQHGTGTLLVLEYIESTSGFSRADYNTDLAHALARLHATVADPYGLDRDNFIGATPQTNRQCPTWPEFFADQRLRAIATRLQNSHQWPTRWTAPFDRLLQRLPDVLPERPPASLVHGDLWSGNVMTGSRGNPVLIDPAAYYGHAETDLAMMQLFGGFNSAVFDVYDDVAGLQPGFEERTSIYNLYHLFNHVLLFGAGYHTSVEKTLDRF